MSYCISCFYEYISVWMNKLICQGFVFFRRKPHPKGKEYRTICCGKSVKSGIICGWVIVEGRYHMIPMGRPKFDTSPNIKTAGLMLQLTKSLWSAGKAVIM